MAEKKKTVAETVAHLEKELAINSDCIEVLIRRVNSLSDVVDRLSGDFVAMYNAKNQAKRNGNLPVGDTGKMAMSSEEFVISKIKDAAKGL